MLGLVSTAYAAGEGGGGIASFLGPIGSFLPIILIFPIFYFLVIMPQQKQRKKHAAMIDGLKKGDKVVTSSGIIGTIVSVDKDTIVLLVATEVKLRMLRSAISEVRSEE
ncbi:MAG: preprotein translocase subunit YajC [Nitrospirae bacterium]|nr:preprotein translocase subunit YajC [Nitrospirota bacterium]